jgi:Protein of unknown function (DUF1501)
MASGHHTTSQHNSAAYDSLTGHKPVLDIVTADASATDFPSYGAIVDKLAPSAKRGHIHGASDDSGAFPKDAPWTPDDIAATMLHGLGIDSATERRDQLDRPIPVSHAAPILPLLA